MGILEDLQAEIPCTTSIIAIILLIINIIFPGIGTVVMAFIGGFKPKTLIVGILQFFTAFLIIGWIWSIWWGIVCLTKSK